MNHAGIFIRESTPRRLPHPLFFATTVDLAGCEPADYEGIVFRWQRNGPSAKISLTMTGPLKPLSVSLPPAVGKLERQARAAGELAAAVRAVLPEELRPHLLTAARRGEELVLTVDSAAWAARVRYAGPRLTEGLAAAGQPAVGKLRIRVRGR